jgi:serine/threonine-protein kinase RsbW
MVRTIKIASSRKNINEVEYYLNTIFRESKFSRKVYCRIFLAVSEAVNNAIFHGNNEDKSKFVIIEFKEFQEYIQLNIADEGLGFDYTNVPDPRNPQFIRNESGRGIFIMKEYADKVYFQKNGALVQLIFNK